MSAPESKAAFVRIPCQVAKGPKADVTPECAHDSFGPARVGYGHGIAPTMRLTHIALYVRNRSQSRVGELLGVSRVQQASALAREECFMLRRRLLTAAMGGSTVVPVVLVALFTATATIAQQATAPAVKVGQSSLRVPPERVSLAPDRLARITNSFRSSHPTATTADASSPG